jgi:hypothetical protein
MVCAKKIPSLSPIGGKICFKMDALSQSDLKISALTDWELKRGKI